MAGFPEAGVEVMRTQPCRHGRAWCGCSHPASQGAARPGSPYALACNVAVTLSYDLESGQAAGFR